MIPKISITLDDLDYNYKVTGGAVDIANSGNITANKDGDNSGYNYKVAGGAIDMSQDLIPSVADISSNLTKPIENNVKNTESRYKITGGAIGMSQDLIPSVANVSDSLTKPIKQSSRDLATKYTDSDVPQDKVLKVFAAIESNGMNVGPNSSGYEGIYQFRYRKGDLGKKLADKLGVTPDYVRRHPEIQHEMMKIALQDYKKGLLRHNLPPTILNLYMVHNQGLGGTLAIYRVLNNKGSLGKHIRHNILNQFSKREKLRLKNVSDKDLVKIYINKFKSKINKYLT